MWNKPQLMTAVSDLLFWQRRGLAGRGGRLGSRAAPVSAREVQVTQRVAEVRRSELEEVLAGRAARQLLQPSIWRRCGRRRAVAVGARAEARRQWPSRIESHRGARRVAYWGDATGSWSTPRRGLHRDDAVLPRAADSPLSGRTVRLARGSAYYQEFARADQTAGRVPRTLTCRRAWPGSEAGGRHGG
jgi:hypothetical protein